MSKERSKETSAQESADKLPEVRPEELAQVHGGRRGRGPGRRAN
jgi:hypothetical protein